MITLDHPYYFIAKLCDNPNAVFTLSKYVYKVDSLFDEREYLSVTSKEFTEKWVDKLIATLSPEQELAIHSKVMIKNKVYHIPMIDFSVLEQLSSKDAYRLKQFLPKNVYLNLALYASGRSFHAYSTALISTKQWVDLMGRLLLVNHKDSNNIIDTRWIGHRLIGGFSSLRWSNNSGLYLTEPRRIEMPI